jgi:hypothetical protein
MLITLSNEDLVKSVEFVKADIAEAAAKGALRAGEHGLGHVLSMEEKIKAQRSEAAVLQAIGLPYIRHYCFDPIDIPPNISVRSTGKPRGLIYRACDKVDKVFILVWAISAERFEIVGWASDKELKTQRCRDRAAKLFQNDREPVWLADASWLNKDFESVFTSARHYDNLRTEPLPQQSDLPVLR